MQQHPGNYGRREITIRVTWIGTYGIDLLPTAAGHVLWARTKSRPLLNQHVKEVKALVRAMRSTVPDRTRLYDDETPTAIFNVQRSRVSRPVGCPRHRDQRLVMNCAPDHVPGVPLLTSPMAPAGRAQPGIAVPDGVYNNAGCRRLPGRVSRANLGFDASKASLIQRDRK